MPLTKDQIAALAGRRETRTVEVAGFGEFTLKEMSGTDRDAWEQSMMKIDGHGNAQPNMANRRAKLLSMCLVDENGVRMFTSAQDVATLGSLPARVLSELEDVANEMNGLTDEAVDDLAGNSDAAESGASTSA